MKRDNIFWGVCFVLGAILLIGSRLWGDYDIGIFKVMVTIICVAIIIRGVPALNFWEILLPIAMLCTLYHEELYLTGLTPWTLFGAAILGSIGLELLFKDKRSRRQHYWRRINGDEQSAEYRQAGQEAQSAGTAQGVSYTGEYIRLSNHFSGSTKYINTDKLKNAYFDNSFGSLEIYFDNAMIQGMADIVADVSFGELVLHIPRTWYFENNVKVFFGSVDEKGRCQSTGAPVIKVSGNVSFGSLVIHYI